MHVINVINLDPRRDDIKTFTVTQNEIQRYREERLLSIVNQSKQHGFAVRFWEGVVEKFSHIGISKAFKNIIRWAKEKNQPRVIIAEDDMVLTSPNAWEYFLDNTPRKFDIYLSGIYAGMLDGNRIINGYSGHTLIMVSRSCYDLILSADESTDLDRWLGRFCLERKFIVCLPYVAKQLGGYTDNHRRRTEYDAYHREMEFYEG